MNNGSILSSSPKGLQRTLTRIGLRRFILFLTLLSFVTTNFCSIPNNMLDLGLIVNKVAMISSDVNQLSKNFDTTAKRINPTIKEAIKSINNFNKIGKNGLKLFDKKSKVFEKLIRETNCNINKHSLVWANLTEKILKEMPTLLKGTESLLQEINNVLNDKDKTLCNLFDRYDESLEKTKAASKEIIFYSISRGCMIIAPAITALLIIYKILFIENSETSSI